MFEIVKNRLAAARSREEGFTLIELMVVVLIIAVLLAIAIPTFLGAQSKAKDRNAQSSARNALTAASTVYADTGAFSVTATMLTDLAAVEPSLTYAATSTTPKSVSVVVAGTPTVLYVAVRSDTGKCFYIKETKTAPTQFASGPDASSACTAGATPTGASAYIDKW